MCISECELACYVCIESISIKKYNYVYPLCFEKKATSVEHKLKIHVVQTLSDIAVTNTRTNRSNPTKGMGDLHP